MKHQKSDAIFERAKKVMPGGVNSPVRAFQSVDRNPIFVEKAHGVELTDVDENVYTDFICSWGPLILGHSPNFLKESIEAVFEKGTSYGVPTALEVEMAELITEAYPAVEMVRMVNSGTEATMSAIRVARAYTQRKVILKFEGCYHGHSDALLVKSGSGLLTYGVPTSPGVPEETTQHTMVATFNDIQGLKKIFEEHGREIACVIVEPVAGNMGVVPATQDFLNALREYCDHYQSVLIFDEVITGFRIAYGGGSEVYGIKPDMACFGKIIGGGLPVGAYGGKREIMQEVSPVGSVYQAGTLSGNPLAMYMGIETLKVLSSQKSLYESLEEKAIYLESVLLPFIEENKIPVSFSRFKSMPCLFFTPERVESYEQVKTCDLKMYARYFNHMLDSGILIPPAQFEGLFLSTEHHQIHLDQYLDATKAFLSKLI